jgi:ABC-type multidrug transport system ATPase subunit
MLTGLIPPNRATVNGDHVPNASIYGNSILTQLREARLSMGVCPQHDVLFDNLTVREHILFFSQLKGKSYEEADAEATALTTLFHLQTRLDNTGDALSGGQKRKLSIAIAVCGGSKLVILDEPTAG